ncbi:MAG: flavodoxin family protein [Aquabacterium sp.]
MSKSLLIVYHSMTGGTKEMAEAVAAGAAQEVGVVVQLRHASEVGTAEVLSADGYVFATPENLAAISGVMKDFFDRTYYDVLDQVNGRPYAAMVCAGSDGHNAARQLERIATGWRLRPIAEPLIVLTHAQSKDAIQAPKRITEADIEACQALGEAMASGLAMGVF